MLKKSRRLLSIILVFVMIPSMIGFAAAAANTATHTYIYEIEGSHEVIIGGIEIIVDGPYSASSGFSSFEGAVVFIYGMPDWEYEMRETSSRIAITISENDIRQCTFIITIDSNGKPVMTFTDYSLYYVNLIEEYTLD